MSSRHPPPPAADCAESALEPRATSLWPHSLREGEGLTTAFDNLTRFDPRAEGVGALVGGRAGVQTRWDVLVRWMQVTVCAVAALGLAALVALAPAGGAWGVAGAGVLALVAGLALGLAWAQRRASRGSTRPSVPQGPVRPAAEALLPHLFVVSAIGTARALTMSDPPGAMRLLDDLGALCRQADAEARGDGPGSLSLTEEIALARRYLAIEQVRHGARLRVRWEIDPQAGRARVPPLVLQPLVDNALRHGVEAAPEGGDLTLRVSAGRGRVEVLILNALTEDALATPGGPRRAMAAERLLNERLRLLHGNRAHCDTWCHEAHFHARIVVPLA